MAPKPKPPKTPKPVKTFWLAAYMFEFQEAGPIREPLLGLCIGDGTNSRYYGWDLNLKEHASSWAIVNYQEVKYTVFSGLTGNVPLTQYELPHPVTIDELVPTNNRTQIAIVRQTHRPDSFLVRFIISYDNDEKRHQIMVEYPGVAPGELFGKPFWGHLHEAGNVPASVAYLFPGDRRGSRRTWTVPRK
jgi:hypothetical protein